MGVPGCFTVFNSLKRLQSDLSINLGNQWGFFQIEIVMNFFSQLFPIHLNLI